MFQRRQFEVFGTIDHWPVLLVLPARWSVDFSKPIVSHPTMAPAADPCVGTYADGIQYREFSCVYPQLEPFYHRYGDGRHNLAETDDH
jgi:hypothetical protein